MSPSCITSNCSCLKFDSVVFQARENPGFSMVVFFFFLIMLFKYFELLSLCCCASFTLIVASRGYSLVAV